MAKKFNMAELAKEALGDVRLSEVDTVKTIDVGLILANEANFYEMSDLEELAASIELVGLLHPVVVKPREGAGYVLIDGERRFRAMTDVLGRTEIPCIVRQPVNDVVEELMLIEANRTQRKMTSADLSKQAERYTELLAKLKEAGVEIPGRLRDRVAEALQVSSSKLARLHAIRENLTPEMLEDFDAGKLNESVAYELSKQPQEKQTAVYMHDGYMPEALTAADVPALVSRACRSEQTKPRTVASGSDAGTSWDATEYIRQREKEDDNFRHALEEEARPFIRELEHVFTRHEGIEKLKDTFGRCYHSHWGLDAAEYDASPKGLKMSSKALGFRDILRTWTEVYDMLSIIALHGAAAMDADEDAARVSELNTKPAGLEWHRVTEDDLPPDDGEVVFWGSKGLRTAVAGSRVNYCQMWPAEYAWWATVEGPEV